MGYIDVEDSEFYHPPVELPDTRYAAAEARNRRRAEEREAEQEQIEEEERLLSAGIWPDGKETEYEYDEKGNLLLSLA